MKHSTMLQRTICACLLFIMSSCIEYYKISTTVHADGSITRTIQVVGDSSSVFEGHLFIPSDTSWKITTKWLPDPENDSIKKKKYEYTASKKFKNTVELNSFFKIDADTSSLTRISANFDKKFRWFFSYVTYTETYKKIMPFDYYDIEDYMSESEYSYISNDNYIYVKKYDSLVHIKDLEQMPLLNHADSLRMEELEAQLLTKISKWINLNIAKAYLELLKEAYNDYSPETTSKILQQEETILKMPELDSITLELFDTFNVVETINKKLSIKEDSLKKIATKEHELFKYNEEVAISALFDYDEIRNHINMPGLMLETNADSLNNNTAYWIFNGNHYYAKDYTLLATSRIINKWAYWISGGVVSLLLLLVFKRTKRW